jgi:peptidoglycan/xylan/chitin deacetylase (PgdA/CDA1 family)
MSVTILCYHKVGPASEEGRRLNIEPLRLQSHVRYFARKNRPFVVAGDLPSSLQDGIVCFTFDDAYVSTMVHAPLIFEEQGVHACFYAVAGRVGDSS